MLVRRRYRVRGLAKNLAVDVYEGQCCWRAPGDDLFHVDTFDLYSAKARANFIAAGGGRAAVEAGDREGATWGACC